MASALAATPATAQDYYAGKTIEFIVGGDAGGGYDIYARAVARHCPGTFPAIPTSWSRTCRAPAAPAPASISRPWRPRTAQHRRHDAGRDHRPAARRQAQCAVRPDQGDLYRHRRLRRARLRDLPEFQDQELRGCAEEKTIVGASAAGGATRDYAYLHNHTAGTKFEVVSGYKGTVDIALAMERGEVDGLCGWDWSSVKSQKADWVRDKKLNILVQVGLEPQQELTGMGVPHDLDVRQERGRPQGRGAGGQPAGVPALLYRSARHAGGADQDPAHRLRRHHEGSGVPGRCREDEDLDHAAAGPEVQDIVTKLYATPRELVERAAR